MPTGKEEPEDRVPPSGREAALLSQQLPTPSERCPAAWALPVHPNPGTVTVTLAQKGLSRINPSLRFVAPRLTLTASLTWVLQVKGQSRLSLRLTVTWVVSAKLGVKPRSVGLQPCASPSSGHGLGQKFPELMAASEPTSGVSLWARLRPASGSFQ